MRITKRMLKEIDACKYQIASFERVFGKEQVSKGILVTRKSLQKAINNHLHLGLFIDILTQACLDWNAANRFRTKWYSVCFPAGIFHIERDPKKFMLCFADLRKEIKKDDSQISRKLKKELFSR